MSIHRPQPDAAARPAIVLDTNVFVGAGFNPRSACARVLALVRDGAVRLVWDDATREETTHIVGRIPPLAGTRVLDVFRTADRFTGETRPEAFALVPDPDDRKFAALASATGATLLTLDAHLLVARNDAGVAILTPREFLARIGDPA